MAEKSCANPRCTCPAEPGKEFFRLIAERQKQALPVPAPMRGALTEEQVSGLTPSPRVAIFHFPREETISIHA